MSEELFESCKEQELNGDLEENTLTDRIEEAYKVYESCEATLNKWIDDYGEYKIAKLRLEFAKYELINLIKAAEEKEIDIDNDIKKIFFSETGGKSPKI
ncbi:MAG TPA: hypothetical protein VIO64_04605 [Pseudobacteroides sp.]|uniref:hypothetical protein n=1 Tax=Pseudobacteroides sp. TaxID=1968840 RepID=UPI002F92A674